MCFRSVNFDVEDEPRFGRLFTHTSLMTRKKLRELRWKVLMHPPDGPNIAPSD